MRAIKILLALAVFPAIALGVAYLSFSNLGDLPPAEAASQGWACANDILSNRDVEACDEQSNSGLLLLGAGLAFGLGFLTLLLIRISAPLLGGNRTILAYTFFPVALLLALLIGLVSLSNIGLLAWTGVVAAKEYTEFSPDILYGIAGFLMIGALFATFGALRAFFKRPVNFVIARPISLFEYPRLGLIIKDVAKKLGARMPDNVLMGLQPTFFASSAPIQTPYTKDPLKGETLHLSVPLMNTFTKGELRAVIGHELGHFRGGDTQYTMKFAPIYRGLNASRDALADKERPIAKALSFSSLLMMDDLVHEFSKVEKRISRGRELRADECGAEVSSPEDIAYSLLKSSVLDSVWTSQMKNFIEQGTKGIFYRNLVKNYQDRVRLDVDRDRLAPLLKFALGDSISHPTDSHPPTEERLDAFRLDLDVVCYDDEVLHRFFEAKLVPEEIDDIRSIEEDLTTLYYHIYSQFWPDEDKELDVDLLYVTIMTDFLATMVTIDGHADDREIEEAERHAAQFVQGMDADRFRERCRHPEDIPALPRLISIANKLLTEQGRTGLKSILRSIAEADGQIHPAEKEMLDTIELELIGED